MDKSFILGEIHRIAKDGKGPGQKLFAKETGIKTHEWLGVYWARWGDALSEAGYTQNEWTSAFEESYLLKCLLQLTEKLGKFPTKYEIGLERKTNPDFPSYNPISKIGSRSELKEKLLTYCSTHPQYLNVVKILEAIPEMLLPEATNELPTNENESISGGYVYLIKAQDAYKLGSTRAPYRRAAEIANQSANGAELLHTITTDDPEGIEKYWHMRFAEKRIAGNNKQSGEWFQLSSDEIRIFRRRKTM